MNDRRGRSHPEAGPQRGPVFRPRAARPAARRRHRRDPHAPSRDGRSGEAARRQPAPQHRSRLPRRCHRRHEGARLCLCFHGRSGRAHQARRRRRAVCRHHRRRRLSRQPHRGAAGAGEARRAADDLCRAGADRRHGRPLVGRHRRHRQRRRDARAEAARRHGDARLLGARRSCATLRLPDAGGSRGEPARGACANSQRSPASIRASPAARR